MSDIRIVLADLVALKHLFGAEDRWYPDRELSSDEVKRMGRCLSAGLVSHEGSFLKITSLGKEKLRSGISQGRKR